MNTESLNCVEPKDNPTSTCTCHKKFLLFTNPWLSNCFNIMSREDKENLIRLEQEQLTGSAQHEAEIAVKKEDYAQRSKTLMKQLILIKQIKIKSTMVGNTQ